MDEDDEFGADADFLAALARSEVSSSRSTTAKITQPTPQRIVQPTPQRLDRAPPTPAAAAQDGGSAGKIVQPTPQVIGGGARSSGATIQVSPRQKGNPILTHLRSFAWEYADIPADYVLGTTTCALFLSLKYHRLHPEYIYNRIRGLQGKYGLRIMLTMVDIGNHEEALKELSKTSLVNNVTVMLCWSASEAGRYLELYKSYEHANASAIRGVAGPGGDKKGYAERMVDFVTVPRSVNKTDAVTLVSAFGSVRAAVNAAPEEIAVLSGWGEKKVKRWCEVVDEPFRLRKAAKRTLLRKETTYTTPDGEVVVEHEDNVLDRARPLSRVPVSEMSMFTDQDGSSAAASEGREASVRPTSGNVDDAGLDGANPDDDGDDEEVLAAMFRADAESQAREQGGRAGTEPATGTRQDEQGLGGGVAAALAKLREAG